MKRFFALVLIIFQTLLFSQEWQSADKVIAIVNNQPVIASHLDEMYDIAQKRVDKKMTKKQLQELKNSVLDNLISEILLYQAADEESIIVSKEKIDNQIKDLMKFNGFSDLEKFKKSIEKSEKMPYDMYVEELKKQLTLEQIMVYSMDFVPPSEADARSWYDSNRERLLQVRFQRILIEPKNDSFAEEKRANELATDLYNKINSGSSFESLARQNSEDKESAKNGGVIGWTSFAEVDPDIAGIVYQMKERRLYPVFKTKRGYNVVRYYGTRTMPYEEIRDRIFQMIAQQARHEQFNVWVAAQREMAEVNVYLEGYEYVNPYKDALPKNLKEPNEDE